MSQIPVAVVGASGYSGEQLCALLAAHPDVEISMITSRQNAGRSVQDVIPRLRGNLSVAGLSFSEPSIDGLIDSGAEYVFLATPHGLAAEYAAPLFHHGKRILDLSADFRLRTADLYREFYLEEHPEPKLLEDAVYGMPELYRPEIEKGQLIACPGCYPTTIILSLAPLLQEGLIDPDSIVISSVSGVSGAGRKAEVPYLFAECNESVRAYGLPKHRHLGEIEQELTVMAGKPVTVTFVPHLVPITKGMHTTIFADLVPGTSEQDIEESYLRAYAEEPFIRMIPECPDVKNVTGTNFLDVSRRIDERTGRIVVLAAQDNLIKGASGQALQCFNLLARLPETTGLL